MEEMYFLWAETSVEVSRSSQGRKKYAKPGYH